MKKLLILGAALLSLCAVGQTARAGGDDRDYREYRNDREYRDYSRDDDCPPPRHYEGRIVEREYCPPPVRVFLPPPPIPFVYGRGYYHHRHYRPHGYGYYRPGIHVGIDF